MPYFKTKSKESLINNSSKKWQLPLATNRDSQTFSSESLFDLIYYTGQEENDFSETYSNKKSPIMRHLKDIDNIDGDQSTSISSATEDFAKPKAKAAYNLSHSLTGISKTFYVENLNSIKVIKTAVTASNEQYKNLVKKSIVISNPLYRNKDNVVRKCIFNFKKGGDGNYQDIGITFEALFSKFYEKLSSFMFPSDAESPDSNKDEYKKKLFELWWERYVNNYGELTKPITLRDVKYDYTLDLSTFANGAGGKQFIDDFSLVYHDENDILYPYAALNNGSGYISSSMLGSKIVLSLTAAQGKDNYMYCIQDSKGGYTVSIPGLETAELEGDNQRFLFEFIDDKSLSYFQERFGLSSSSATIDIDKIDEIENKKENKGYSLIYDNLAIAKKYIYQGSLIALSNTDNTQSILFSNDIDEEKEALIKPFISFHDFDESPLIQIEEEEKIDYKYFNSVRLSPALINDLLLPLLKPFSVYMSVNALTNLKTEGAPYTYMQSKYVAPENDAYYNVFKKSVKRIPLLDLLREVLSLSYYIDVDDPIDKNGDLLVDSEIIWPFLKNEKVLFGAQFLGDFINQSLFTQTLRPDSEVTFNKVNIANTVDDFYIQQTKPLIDSISEEKGVEITKVLENGENLSPENKAHKFNEFIVTDLNSSGENLFSLFPQTFFDIDLSNNKDYYSKIKESFWPPVKSTDTDNFKSPLVFNSENNILVKDKIISPTIDNIWEYLKLVTESTDENILPEFEGIFVSKLKSINKPNASKKRLYGKAFKDKTLVYTEPEQAVEADVDVDTNLGENGQDNNVIDILRYSIDKEYNSIVENSIEEGNQSIDNEYLVYNGYKVSKFIEKPIDYLPKFFGKRNFKQLFHFDDNEAWPNQEYIDYISRGNKVQVIQKSKDDDGLIYELEDDHSGYLEPLEFMIDSNFDIIDNNQISDTSSEIQKSAFNRIKAITNFGENDLQNFLTSRYVHYKEYKQNPKTLRVLERDLEEVRQNMLAFSEILVNTFVKQGYLNSEMNNGGLFQLHRNYYTLANNTPDGKESFNTYIKEDYDAISEGSLLDPSDEEEIRIKENEKKLYGASYFSEENAILNNELDGQKEVESPDNRVIYDDGDLTERYTHDMYDRYYSDITSDFNKVIQKPRISPRKANSTSLSEVYLAADGTWRSIHEHVQVPILEVYF